MSCCDSIIDTLKSVLSAIAPIVAIALMAFAVYAIFLAGPGAFSFLAELAWVPAGVAAMEASTLGYIALGAALIVSPETVTDIATSVAETVGSVAGTVVTGIAGGLVGGLFGGSGSIIGYAALAALGYYFFFRKKSPEEEERAALRAEAKAEKSEKDYNERVKSINTARALVDAEPVGAAS